MELNKAKNIERIRQLSLLFMLLLEIVLFSLLAERFFSFSNAISILRQVSVTGISAMGMFMIILLGDIDLSVGSMYAFIGVISALIFKTTESAVLAIIAALVIGTVIGFINGTITAKFKIPAFITTLATMSVCSGLAYIITKGTPIGVTNPAFTFLGSGYVAGVIPLPIIFMLIVLALGYFTMYKTRFGRPSGQSARARAQNTAAPTSAPKSTSLGQWTYRYSREKAMATATASAGFQRGEPLAFRANTAAKDAAVCPEGNEASVGGGTSSSTGWTTKGRTRPTRGFKIRLHSTRSVTRAHPTASPCRRYRFTASSTAASTIQISPWLHVQLSAGIKTSKAPQRRLAWIQSSIPSSSCCMACLLFQQIPLPGYAILYHRSLPFCTGFLRHFPQIYQEFAKPG
mgnify:CR=1 FL=1